MAFSIQDRLNAWRLAFWIALFFFMMALIVVIVLIVMYVACRQYNPNNFSKFKKMNQSSLNV